MNFLFGRIYRSLNRPQFYNASIQYLFYLVSLSIIDHISLRQDVKHLQLHAERPTDLDSEGQRQILFV